MEGNVVRRVVPADNCCLFNAVGYVMERNKNKARKLRQVIAATVARDPRKYTQAFLEVPNAQYCAWILSSQAWGGAIELSILADYYGREIAVYDTRTTRCMLYGQGRRYSERAMLIYTGQHYDALAMSPYYGAPEQFDQTIFRVGRDRTIGRAEELALGLVRRAASELIFPDRVLYLTAYKNRFLSASIDHGATWMQNSL